MRDVCDVRDGTHDSPQYLYEGYSFVTSKNVKDGKINFTNVSYVSKEDFDNINLKIMTEQIIILLIMFCLVYSI